MMRITNILLIVLLSACIDPLQIGITTNTQALVVDGMITDQPGPYTINLYLSNDLKPITPKPFTPLEGAAVFISDDLGNDYPAIENSPGSYQTNAADLTGVVGRSYSLTITTSAGQQYQSAPQLMRPGGSVDNLRFEFEPDAMAGNEPDQLIDALNVSMDATGNENGNLFRWRWTTTIEVKTFPELRTRVPPGSEQEVPDPDPCSGYVFLSGQLVKVSECVCCICWTTSYNSYAYVSTSDFVEGIQFNNVSLGKLPVTPMHFYDKYYILVEQLSLSEEAYTFWQLVQKQQQGATSIFQPNAIKIRGNIRNVNDEDDEVLGFFSVSSVSQYGQFIDPAVIPEDLGPIEVIPLSCLERYPNVTTVKPPFW